MPYPAPEEHDSPSDAERPHLRFWRSLVEYEHPEAFQNGLAPEFAETLEKLPLETSRRKFLKLAGASIALAGLAGCTAKPEEKIFPFVRQPENLIPGVPKQYATAMSMSGSSIGLLVESHMGRPTKVEGNPLHPGSLGATDVFAQAAVLTLYDPERSQTVKNAGRVSTWDEFLTDATPRFASIRAREGRGLRILTPTVGSPTLSAQISALLEALPEAKWHEYEPVSRDNVAAGAKMAFGEPLEPVYDFSKADVVLSLDADFLASGPGHLRYARDFMQRRNVAEDPSARDSMNRLYAVETTPTLTGAKADHCLALRVGEVDALARGVASHFGIDVRQSPNELEAIPEQWLDVVCEDLEAAGERALVVAGPWQPAAVHAMAHAINDRLGNAGTTVIYADPAEGRPAEQAASLAALASAMRIGEVEMLLILDGNPVFDAPADLNFEAAMDSVDYRVHLSLYEDETSANCHWHVPAAHFLESWSDVRGYDGTASIVQPLIAPLYGGKSPHELLAAAQGESATNPYDILRNFWKQKREDGSFFAPPDNEEDEKTSKLDFEDWWQTILHDGVIPRTRLPAKSVALSEELVQNVRAAGFPSTGGEFDVVFRPDPHIWDGRFANNGWLQELPSPLTKLCWDNAALISPKMAERRRLEVGQIVELENEGRRLQLPVFILPGHPENSVTLHFGQGRTRSGSVGRSAGFNVFAVRTSQAMWFAAGRGLNPTGETYSLVTTQDHQAISQVDEAAQARHIIKSGTLAQLQEDPEHPPFMQTGHAHGPEVSMYPPFAYEGYKWGMSINLTSCIGCNACTIACQSENNIPIVGKEEVERGREMHWIRIDRYYEGGHDDPDVHFQPVPCMHCELAPCEPVCPVAATTHSHEGLNEMTYNRCVGTRYCSNNCPYKVRRFNFFEYTKPAEEHETLKMLQNPDVTVRSLGVMEKCTYCVQRINQGRITAEKEHRKIRDGEVVTACQEVCPTQAIVFGDLNDEDSRIAQLQGEKQPLSYGLLEELNTRPRTTYLASLKNPHPKLSKEQPTSH